jgi:Leucine-rich repeat (LRR) protein
MLTFTKPILGINIISLIFICLISCQNNNSVKRLNFKVFYRIDTSFYNSNKDTIKAVMLLDLNSYDPVIFKCKQLEHLSLIETSDTILYSICTLKKLRSLYLSSGKLSYLPDCFFELDSLVELDLSGNIFSDFPEKL